MPSSPLYVTTCMPTLMSTKMQLLHAFPCSCFAIFTISRNPMQICRATRDAMAPPCRYVAWQRGDEGRPRARALARARTSGFSLRHPTPGISELDPVFHLFHPRTNFLYFSFPSTENVPFSLEQVEQKKIAYALFRNPSTPRSLHTADPTHRTHATNVFSLGGDEGRPHARALARARTSGFSLRHPPTFPNGVPRGRPHARALARARTSGFSLRPVLSQRVDGHAPHPLAL